MSKKVWIGKDDVEFWDDLNKLPGDLLAEFKQEARFFKQINDKRDLCVVFPESAEIKMDQPITVLILTSTDAESEVKK